MAQSNGESNGVANGVNGTHTTKPTFLFTSESVGEGHPDKIAYVLPSPVFRRFQLLRNFGHPGIKSPMPFSMPAWPKILCRKLLVRPLRRPVCMTASERA
ncbi:MAG: hypothetical protein Q9228_002139 [Teloschistes exilis]